MVDSRIFRLAWVLLVCAFPVQTGCLQHSTPGHRARPVLAGSIHTHTLPATVLRTAKATPLGSVQGPLSVGHLDQQAMGLCESLPALATFVFAIQNVCIQSLFSPAWFGGQLVLFLASLILAASSLSAMSDGLDARIGVRFWVLLFGVHIFASTAPATLFAILSPVLSSPFSKEFLLAGCVVNAIGSVAEMYTHSQDGWWYHKDGEACVGECNKIFAICLVSTFSFLTLAASPSLPGLLAASAPLALLISKALGSQPWAEQKPAVYAMQGVASFITCVVLGWQLASLWPMLYYVQSITIVRCAKRILETDEQFLHILPSMYGWVSFVISFGLAVHPATAAMSFTTVAGVRMHVLCLVLCCNASTCM